MTSRTAAVSSGFTLLEVLVSLVVFGLLLAGLNQGLRYGMRAWASQTRMTNRHVDLDAIDVALRNMLAKADPGDGNDPAPFKATPDQLQIVVSLPDGAGALPSRRVEAVLLVDAAHRLVLRWRPWVHAERFGPPAKLTETELLRDVSRLDLAYWQPRRGWVTEWHARNLPALIRVRLVFPPNDLRHWPDLVAAPELDPP